MGARTHTHLATTIQALTSCSISNLLFNLNQQRIRQKKGPKIKKKMKRRKKLKSHTANR